MLYTPWPCGNSDGCNETKNQDDLPSIAAMLSRVWSGWRSAVLIVKPETVIGWHRQGFRWYWTWKIRHGRSGRPCVPKETRHLIRTMSRENPLYVDLSFMLTRIDMPLM